jgi:hypothetical protein
LFLTALVVIELADRGEGTASALIPGTSLEVADPLELIDVPLQIPDIGFDALPAFDRLPPLLPVAAEETEAALLPRRIFSGKIEYLADLPKAQAVFF